jgi:alpha-galactosidase
VVERSRRDRVDGELSEEGISLSRDAIYASGGMILSGDDLTTITPSRLAMLKQLQPPTGKAARFADVKLEVGEVELGGGRRAYVPVELGDQPRRSAFRCPRAARVRELWTG